MVGVIMLILDLTRYLLHDILKGHQATGSAEFIDDYGQRPFLLHQLFHQFRGLHGLRHKTDLPHEISNQPGVLGMIQLEHVRGMDVADDMVNILVVDHNLAMATLHENLLQLFYRGSILNGINLRAGNHTVADLGLRKLEGILEDLHLLADILIIGGNECICPYKRLFSVTDQR